jgi:hypothetical protein
MIKTFLKIAVLFSSFAHAGVSLELEHPRFPSRQKDRYKIDCTTTCALEIISLSPQIGSSVSPIFETKIKELLSLKKQGFLPAEKSLDKILYKIIVTDGDEKLSTFIGYPRSYEGTEFSKYSQLISVLEEIRLNMKLELETNQ